MAHNINISINTVATGSGAQQTAAGLAQVHAAAGSAAASMQAFTASAASASAASRLLSGEARHLVAIFDGLARGQHGQVISSIGAAMRSAGLGAAALVTGVAALSAAMGAAALVHGAEKMGEFAEKQIAAAKGAGMSLSQYSALDGAFALLGGKAGMAASSLEHFAKSTTTAVANAASIQAQAFHALGYSQDDIIKKSQNMSTFVVDVLDKIGHHQGPHTATAAIELMGHGWEKLGPLMDAGAAGIEAAQEKARKFGTVLSQETAEAMIKTEREANALGERIRGSTMTAFVAWGPVIESIIAVLGGLGSAISTVISWIEKIPQALRDVALAGGKIISPGSFLDVNEAANFSTPTVLPPKGLHGPTQLSDINVFGGPKGGHRADHGPARAAMAEYRSELADLQGQLQNLTRDRQLDARMAEAQFAASKGLDYGEGRTGRYARAEAEYGAYRAAQEHKLAALEDFRAKAMAIHQQMEQAALKEFAVGGEKYKAASAAEQSAKIWGEDSAAYKKATSDKIAADKEFEIQHQEMVNRLMEHQQNLVNAHTAAVQEATREWASAFDQIGTTIESTIGTAIKSAFQPMKPSYWYSSTSGPHGQPLTQAHRISPTSQLMSQAEFSVLGSLSKAMQDTLMTSLAKSIFPGSTSFGEGLAKTIGLGTPGGLFSTGLGAVKDVSFETTQTSLLTSIAVNTGGILANTAATAALDTANAGTSGISAAGSVAGGAAGGVSFFKWLGGLLPFGFASGGIVPSAAGGWAVPSYAGGGLPSLLHAGEMVLPSNISKGLQNMIGNGGGGGDMHMHFHGPADSNSISRWFKENMMSNSDAIRQMFRQNSLTPRSL